MLRYSLCWGTTKRARGLGGGSNANGAKATFVCAYWGTVTESFDLQVVIWLNGETRRPWRIRKSIPVKVEEKPKPPQSSPETHGSGSLHPHNEGSTGRTCTRTRHAENERDYFDAIATEITIVTTRKRLGSFCLPPVPMFFPTLIRGGRSRVHECGR